MDQGKAMHRERNNRSAEMEYSGARLAANVAITALAAAAATFAATGLIGPALAMAVIGIYRIFDFESNTKELEPGSMLKSALPSLRGAK
jgi:hypothetical protein